MPDEFDPSKFFDMLRKSASVKAGAIMFGEAQVAYYDTLKQHMSDEEAYNMLAHTTEVIVRSVAATVGPLADVLVRAAAMAEMFGLRQQQQSDKEVPGGNE